MKRTSAIHLTLAATAALLVAGCADRDRPEQSATGGADWEEPEQVVQCYQDPQDPDVCVQEARPGFFPLYYPMFFRGMYFNQQGRAAAAPPVGSPAYRTAQARSVGTVFTPSGPVARGGFGSTGMGRSAAS